jgi:glutamate--cysteine ligase
MTARPATLDIESSGLSATALSSLEKHIKENGLPIARGIEKEGLRADPASLISQADHPQALGHPLTHASITTDYSEALLELITPVKKTREDLLNTLTQTHEFVATNIGEEVLWSGSMPCKLDGEESIRIAEYGDSNIGQLKYVYRQGLGVRYGRVMQSIAGLHFNFSIDDTLWQALLTNQDNPALSLQDFKSEQYFALIRNFRRYSWLLMYLFGASPCLDQSFVKGQAHSLAPLDDKGTLYKPYATSLRMGDLGYHNNAQSSLNICFNNLSNFTHTLGRAIHSVHQPYQEIGLFKDGEPIQINTNILQIENEYYSSIRPKRTTQSGETPRHALTERGVEYIEVRCLDLNPFLAVGISDTQIDFMDLFLSYCLLKDSPVIDDQECKSLDENFDLVVNEGRKPGLTLQDRGSKKEMATWGNELLSSMSKIATILDQANDDRRYTKALAEQQAKLDAVDLCPSAQVLKIMQDEQLSWLEFAGELSHKHKATLAKSASQSSLTQSFISEGKQSFLDAEEIKNNDQQSFESYLQSYQSE